MEIFPRAIQLVEKGKAFSDKRVCASLCASASAYGGHSTLAAREVFLCYVHAAAKNDLNLFLACGQETLRGFLTVCIARGNFSTGDFNMAAKN